MNTVGFIFAAVGLLILAGYIYLNYPKAWRKNPVFNIISIAFHLVGTVALFLILVCYKNIQFEWMKIAVSRAGAIYYVVVLYMAILCTFRHVIRFIYIATKRVFRRPFSKRDLRMIFDHRVHSVVFLVLSFLVAIYGFINVGILHITKYDVHISKECDLDELNIVFIADTHCGAGTWAKTYDKLAEDINSCNPDVVLIGGDVFDETTSEKDVENMRGVIEKIHPEMGVYFIYGNHDDSTDDWAEKTMESMGVTVLKDEMVVLGKDGVIEDGAEDAAGVQLIGRLDPMENPLGLKELMNKLHPDQTEPIIMLNHRPEHFQEMSGLGVDLALSGHTHGFNIPQFAGRNLAYDMYYGFRDYDGMKAITTSGVSVWGFHYRFPSKSEIVNVHVTFGDKND